VSAPLRVAVVVGNPRPASRTRVTAELVAEGVAGAPAGLVVDLAEWAAALVDHTDPSAGRLVDEVRAADVLVVASPTYKATYTGLLKLFLDWFPADGLRGVVAVPLMLGAGPTHALAPELALRPLLTELGASVPTRGLYVLDAAYDDPGSWAGWLETARPQITALTALTTGASR
jgi:FMN reductase